MVSLLHHCIKLMVLLPIIIEGDKASGALLTIAAMS